MPRPSRIEIGPRKTTKEKADAAVLRMGKAKRVCSLSEFEARTGFDRGTIARWIKAGCPTERVGGKSEATTVDMRDVMLWREEQARIEVRKESASAAPETGADLDAELKRAQIDYQKIRIAERTGLLVLRSEVELNQGITLNAFRTAVDGQADRVERLLVGFPVATVRRAKEEIRDSCRAALMEAQTNMDNAFRIRTRERLEEFGAEPDAFDDEVEPEEDVDGDA